MSTTVYGNQPHRSIKKDVISSTKKTYGLGYPLVDRGYFAKQSGVELVRNNLNQLLKTVRGERVMLPNFGTNLPYYLFEPLDRQLFLSIRQDILETITRYAPGVEVQKLTVIPNDQVNLEGVQGLNISLTVKLTELNDQILDFTVSII